ncbi:MULTISPECIES: hypothetical protein [Streptomyces]|uniref:hypothetical protein n=1 Tax=Streptomyces TaxID=1883 RepID=UPI0003AB1ADF|nr:MULTISPECIES: hypothetical protein [Streptomyces]AOW89373.1 hypothetical protein BC342_25810 [Streptomyces olivaceus]MBZ6112691.1 hypothetical protein [Streptomyces olivaceus]MBZ6126464.1 hypothetical protein [Streptomyces olivaceus]MBZ6147473.1 hypothetical protein [Streptomyces olivaceus]MBZ6161223.1 hypothetical protein [Streptomyces olivaceus]
MSLPVSPRPPSWPRRRSLLASAAGAALLVGCSGGSGPGGADAGSQAADRARARAARDSQGLAERYAAVMAAHPGLVERLSPLRQEVVRHAEAFDAVRGASSEASPSVSARAAGPGDGSGVVTGTGAVPGTEKEALAVLAEVERTLADRRAGALLEVPGELARLLASVAAAGAAHVYLLTQGGTEGRG